MHTVGACREKLINDKYIVASCARFSARDCLAITKLFSHLLNCVLDDICQKNRTIICYHYELCSCNTATMIFLKSSCVSHLYDIPTNNPGVSNIPYNKKALIVDIIFYQNCSCKQTDMLNETEIFHVLY